MGWRLAEEVAWARPERPGPEWWTLLDIAQDARDETRQSMCGQEYLMGRGKCSRATIYRRLKVLHQAGLIKTVRHAAPGTRAIYEIQVIHRLPDTGRNIAETRSGLTDVETCSGLNGSQTEEQRVSKTALTGLNIGETHAVSYPVSITPSTSKNPVADGPVEGNGLSTGEPSGLRFPTKAERAAWQAAQSRRDRAKQEPA